MIKSILAFLISHTVQILILIICLEVVRGDIIREIVTITLVILIGRLLFSATLNGLTSSKIDEYE